MYWWLWMLAGIGAFFSVMMVVLMPLFIVGGLMTIKKDRLEFEQELEERKRESLPPATESNVQDDIKDPPASERAPLVIDDDMLRDAKSENVALWNSPCQRIGWALLLHTLPTVRIPGGDIMPGIPFLVNIDQIITVAPTENGKAVIVTEYSSYDVEETFEQVMLLMDPRHTGFFAETEKTSQGGELC